MKFTLALADGTWIGGFTARRDNLSEMLEDLRDRASEWKQPIVATRLDRVKRGQQFTVEPR